MNLKIKEMSLIFIISFMIICFSSSAFAADLNSNSYDLVNSDSSSISEISQYDSNSVSISDENSNLNNDDNGDSNSVSISDEDSNLNNDDISDSISYIDSDSVSSYSENESSKNDSVLPADNISISNESLVTKVNGTVVIKIISPNSTVNSGFIEICNKNGSVINKANVTNNTATLNITGLSAGNYSVIVNYLDNNSNNISQKTLNLTINKINIKMEANNLTANFSEGKNFTAKLTDELGNALSGKECTFVLKNILNQTKVYHRTTNIEGIAKLAINLVPGNWTITAFYSGDKDYNLSMNSTGSVVILSKKPIMVANNYTQKYKVSGNFTTKLTDKDGKALSGRECVLVLKNKFNQTKSYYRTTNTDGVAKLAITLIPGLWTITAYYPGNLTCESSDNSVATLNITN